MLLYTSSVHSGSGRYFRVGGVNEEWVCKHAWTRESGGMLPRKMRCSEITSNAIITLLQFPFHKILSAHDLQYLMQIFSWQTWLVLLIQILVWLVVKIQLFINWRQVQGFPTDSHTFMWVRHMITMFNHTLKDLVTVWEWFTLSLAEFHHIACNKRANVPSIYTPYTFHMHPPMHIPARSNAPSIYIGHSCISILKWQSYKYSMWE